MKTTTLPTTTITKNRNYLRGGGVHLLASIIIFMVCSLATQAQTYLTTGDEFQFLCDKDEVMIRLNDTDPGMNVDFINSSGIGSPSHFYDPNTGELYITGVNLTGPKSYGTYEFLLSGADYYFTIYLIECCGKTDFDLIIVTETASALPAINSLDVLILDDLRIDQNTDIDNSQVYFGVDAKISVNAGEDLNIRTSDLQRYCDYRWDGVISESYPSRIEFSSSSIEGSTRGFLIIDDTEFQAIDSYWDNNNIGIGIFDLTANGSYLNSSFVDLDNNLFEITSPTAITQHPSSTISMTLYNNGLGIGSSNLQSIHIYVSESEVHLGDPNNQRNEFRASGIDLGIAVYSELSTTGASNNLFFMVQYGMYAVESKLNIGGASITSRNTFQGSQYYSEESSQSLRYNRFIKTNCIIDLPTNQSIAGITGSYFWKNNIDSSNVTITGNSTTVNIVFDDNNSFMSTTEIGYVTTASLSSGVKLINNNFNRPHDIMIDKYCLRLLYTTGVRVGDNFFGIAKPFGDTSATPIPVIRNHAIYLEGVKDAQIKANVFDHRGKAIEGTGDLTNSLFSCNEFDKSMFGLHFTNATISDQGSTSFGVDNTWDDFGCGSMCGGEARIYAYNVTQFKYYFSGLSGSNKDPYHGIGVDQDILTVDDEPSASVNSNACSGLNKTDFEIPLFQIGNTYLYPNPATNFFSIECECNFIQVIEIFSIEGKMLKKIENVSTHNEISVELPKGIYLVHLQIGKSISVQKLIIH